MAVRTFMVGSLARGYRRFETRSSLATITDAECLPTRTEMCKQEGETGSTFSTRGGIARTFPPTGESIDRTTTIS